jgi:hypothetical protein
MDMHDSSDSNSTSISVMMGWWSKPWGIYSMKYYAIIFKKE